MRVILDAGALVAVERRDRLIAARLRVLQQRQIPVRVSSGVLAQVWRDGRRQANLARVLAGVAVEPIEESDGKRIGELLSMTGTADVADAHVALMAQRDDLILTSDPGDIRALVDAYGVEARIQPVG